MIKFVFLIGLPCSGKTVMGKIIAERTGALFIDDPKSFKEDVEEKIGKNTSIVIADPHLCRKENRISAERLISKIYPSAEFEWIYFENNPEKAIINMHHRMKNGDNRIVIDMIRQTSRVYDIPNDVHIEQIWQPI